MTVPSVEMLLIAGRAVFLLFSFALAAVAFIRWRRAIQAQTERVLANHEVVLQRLADLEARVAATNVCISRLGERIERSQQLASAPATPAPGYQIAIRLAKGGASREELISGCGLSIHEAELVQRLHAPQSRTRSGQKSRLLAAVEPDVC
jgi:alkylation response protein AidB-like acyl-CoA dehydrogenase